MVPPPPVPQSETWHADCSVRARVCAGMMRVCVRAREMERQAGPVRVRERVYITHARGYNARARVKCSVQGIDSEWSVHITRARALPLSEVSKPLTSSKRYAHSGILQ